MTQGLHPDKRRKTVTALFTDVCNFTQMSERLDPEVLEEAMSRYFKTMSGIVEQHQGTVSKFIGDAIMAVFGIPQTHEDDAVRAARTAIEMRHVQEVLNHDLERDYGIRLSVRMGINTGAIVERLDADTPILGDALNIAARLEQAAEPGEILIGDSTYRLIKDKAKAEPVERMRLKGKTDLVIAFRLVSLTQEHPFLSEPLKAMVGRGSQLQEIDHAFQKAVELRSCELLTVLGDAGVGKSRLIAEAASRLQGRAKVLYGRCPSYGKGVTFWPLREVILQAGGIDTDDEVERQAKILSLLAQHDSADAIASQIDQILGKARGDFLPMAEAFWSVRELLKTLAEKVPLVIVFEDVHWAERTFLHLIEYLRDYTRGAAILLICNARPEFVESEWCAAESVLWVEPLNRADSERCVGNLVGADTLPGDTRDRIVRVAGGNPLFIEQTLSMLVDEGILRRRAGHWTATGDLNDIDVPTSIRLLLTSRLDRLEPEDRVVLECASIVGVDVSHDALSEICPVSPDSHLQLLIGRHFLEPVSSNSRGGMLRFSHFLIREVVYESIPKMRRAEFHELLADWMEKHAAERIAEHEPLIGYNFEQAYLLKTELRPRASENESLARRAAVSLAAAGRQALNRQDASTSVNMLTRAAHLFLKEGPSRLATLVDLGDALFEAGDLDKSESVLSEVVEAAADSGDEECRTKALVSRCFVRIQASRSDCVPQALNCALSAINTFSETRADRELANAWNLLGHVRNMLGKQELRRKAMEIAAEHAKSAGDTRREADSRGEAVGAVLHGPSPVQHGVRYAERTLTWARWKGLHKAEAGALGAIAQMEAMSGKFQAARARVQSCRSILDEVGFSWASAWTPEATVELLSGNHTLAQRELRRACEFLQSVGEKAWLSTKAGELAHVLWADGRPEEADAYAQLSRDTAVAEDVASQILWRSAAAKILASRGDLEQAESKCRRVVEIARKTDLVNLRCECFLDLAYILYRAGNNQESYRLIVEARDGYRAKGNLVAAERAEQLLTISPLLLASTDAS
jgi:class 3 adenylate cyclase/predicted ATPase